MAAAARNAKVLGAPAQWCAPGAQGSVEHPALFKIGTVGPAHQRSPTAANNKARCSDKLELRVGCALRRDQDGLIPPKAVQSFAPTTIGQRLSFFSECVKKMDAAFKLQAAPRRLCRGAQVRTRWASWGEQCGNVAQPRAKAPRYQRLAMGWKKIRLGVAPLTWSAYAREMTHGYCGRRAAQRLASG